MNHRRGSMDVPRQVTLNARGRIISLEEPRVMGILNLTPDSFHAGSRVIDTMDALKRAERMLGDGATFLDIGGASSRPGAPVISAEEERGRLMPALRELVKTFPEAVISVDTWRAEVAREALDTGAHIINDITAGRLEPGIIGAVAEAGAPYIVMHMLGTPGDMPSKPAYDNIPGDILRFLVRRIHDLRKAGIRDIVIDPGFGFGKTVRQNFTLLTRLGVFRFLEVPLMIGISRKSMIWRTLEISPEEALNGTTALHMVALQQGVHILRVHDVRPAMETIRLFRELAS